MAQENHSLKCLTGTAAVDKNNSTVNKGFHLFLKRIGMFFKKAFCKSFPLSKPQLLFLSFFISKM